MAPFLLHDAEHSLNLYCLHVLNQVRTPNLVRVLQWAMFVVLWVWQIDRRSGEDDPLFVLIEAQFIVMGWCCVFRCSVKCNGIVYRLCRYPKDPKLRYKWMAACGRKDIFSIMYKATHLISSLLINIRLQDELVGTQNLVDFQKGSNTFWRKIIFSCVILCD